MKFIKLYALLFVFVVPVCAADKVKELNTAGGIKKGQVCKIHMIESINPKTNKKVTMHFVECDDKSHFKNVHYLDGSATGTPAWLTYENFIGSYIIPGTTSNMPGATRIRMIFDGVPRKKKTEAESSQMNTVAKPKISEKLALPLPDSQ